MAVIFYPYDDDISNGSLDQKLEVLIDAAQRYKAAILDAASKAVDVAPGEKKRTTPRDIIHSFNWEEMAKLLREIREFPEGNTPAKINKANKLKKLAEIYEVLRGAKMAKLEAVRIALMNEANQLNSGGSQVA